MLHGKLHYKSLLIKTFTVQFIINYCTCNLAHGIAASLWIAYHPRDMLLIIIIILVHMDFIHHRM